MDLKLGSKIEQQVTDLLLLVSLKKDKAIGVYGVFGGGCANGQILPEMQYFGFGFYGWILTWGDEQEDEQQQDNTRTNANSI